MGIKLFLIPPGEFRMGSEETYLELVDRFPNVREAEEENPVSRLGLERLAPSTPSGSQNRSTFRRMKSRTDNSKSSRMPEKPIFLEQQRNQKE